MARIYDRVDLYFTRRGDFVIGPEGGLFDTSTDVLRSLVQEVRTRLRSDLQDWRLYPTLGANLSDLIGEPNNAATVSALKAKIAASLNQYSLVNSGDLEITHMPIDAHTVLLRLRIRVAATTENYNSESLKIQLIYNYTDGNIHIL